MMVAAVHIHFICEWLKLL